MTESEASKVIDELIVKDHLTFTVNRQDSIIRIYHKQDSLYKQEIYSFKLKGASYETQITKLNAIVKMREADNKDLQKQLNKKNSKGLIAHLFAGVAIVVIIVTSRL